ncbi:MAG TPA: HypC/HybG/HupF family hydrogenase formation chaperone [Planctomycetota bacterium]|nr:HypC/HybG/HupF family hydrogenase formation chaperone [Planctomycetota bacterium]
MCLAIPGCVKSISGDDVIARTAKVSFGGITKEVNLAFTPQACVGDYVLVHVGFALTIVNEAEARRVFDYLKQMNEIQELENSDEVPG